MDSDDVVRPLRPRQPERPRVGRRRRWPAWLLIGSVPVIIVLVTLMRFWVELDWFTELDQRQVLMTRLRWSLAMGVVCGVVTFLVLYVNFRVARRVGENDLFVPFLAPGANPDAPDQPTVPHFVMKPIMLGAALVMGILAGLITASSWETVLRWTGRTDFNVRDPLFDKDVSFYVFTIPLLQSIINFLQAVVVISAITVVIAYVAMGVIRYVPVPRIAHAAVVHFAWLGAIFMIIEAADFRIRGWDLVLSTKGAATGAGYADVHARLPGTWVMIVASLVLAVVIVVAARRERTRLVVGTAMAWLALAVVTTTVVPGLVQRAIVLPNELKREESVLKNNIAMTRVGFALDDVAKEPFTDNADLTAEDFKANTATTSNIRLWSPDVLQRSLAQLQEFRRYYTFTDIDVDRYRIDGKQRQVMLGVREVSQQQLNSPSWVNRRLQYTHGFGAVGAWPNLATDRGTPDLFLRDIPPKPIGQKDIVLDRPEVYYGEQDDVWVVTNTDEKEFNFPDGERNRYVRYAGDGGIRIGNMWRRTALAVTFGDPKLILTGSIRPDSRFMYRRNVRERVEHLAPFLELDSDPYPVILDGKLLWVIDAYTSTDRFPYSTPSLLVDGSRPTYARNSVKATVDAYDGKVTLYAVDEKDPVLAAWRKIFPTLFTDGSKMSPELTAHLRYPEDLFKLQTQKWLTYHMGQVDYRRDKSGNLAWTVGDVQTFYNNEDEWAIPTVDNAPLDAFYVLARLPGSDAEESLLMRPMVPAGGKKNLIAWMAARMDPGHYGEIVTYTLSKQSLTQGPQQVSALIKQQPEIAEQVTLWSRQGTQPIFGNLLVLPIEKSLLYVQPVYLESAEANLPEFEKVVLVLGDTIVWGDTFDDALRQLLIKRGVDDLGGDRVDNGSGDDVTGGSKGDGEPRSDTLGSLSRDQLEASVRRISAAYDKALECQQDGDWACYGEQIGIVQDELERSGAIDGGDADAKRPS